MFGFLLQWPTLVTLLMFPILVWMYARLSIAEEQEMRARFGPLLETYAATTPRFLPSLRKRTYAVHDRMKV
jgi:protein-S-isoprenylcysteine O-methyltransferase Ste14